VVAGLCDIIQRLRGRYFSTTVSVRFAARPIAICVLFISAGTEGFYSKCQGCATIPNGSGAMLPQDLALAQNQVRTNDLRERFRRMVWADGLGGRLRRVV
jgi:hypothetical protein